VRETDDSGDEDVGAFEQLDRQGDVRGSYGCRRDPVAARELDAVADERLVELGTKERVVDRLRDLLVAQASNGELGHVPRIDA
jgi:hypothetical protein